MQNELIISRFQEVGCFCSNPAEHGCGGTETVDNSKEVDQHSVGDRITADAGAPGTGHITWVVTKIDDAGVWGEVIENTIRELEPWEVY